MKFGNYIEVFGDHSLEFLNEPHSNSITKKYCYVFIRTVWDFRHLISNSGLLFLDLKSS